MCEYYTEGPNTTVWLMDFENTHLTRVGKCDLNTWEWENSKVVCPVLSITEGPNTTGNLVIPQVYQMIGKLEMNIITYVHTTRKETITIQTTLDQAVNPDMTNRILKARTQMVESMYKYFGADLSESHRAELYICTLLDPRFKNYNM